MRRILAAVILSTGLVTLSSQFPNGNCARIATTADGYVCSRAAYADWLAYQAR